MELCKPDLVVIPEPAAERGGRAAVAEAISGVVAVDEIGLPCGSAVAT